MTMPTEPNNAEATCAPTGLLAEPLGDSFALETPRLRLPGSAEENRNALHAALHSLIPSVAFAREAAAS